MTLEGFYTTVGALGSTLHGLWWVVVQSKPEWRRDRARRLLAYVISLHFLIPATMSILSVIATSMPLWWQIVFGTSGLLGLLGVVLLIRAIREEHEGSGWSGSSGGRSCRYMRSSP